MRAPRSRTALLSRLAPIAALIALGAALATGKWAIAQPLVLLAVVLTPALLPRTVLYPRAAGPPPEDSDDGGDGGRGPEPRPSGSPDAPRGGIPLPDAAPARIRLRDHDRPPLVPPRPRRPAREPAPAPARRTRAAAALTR